jgi:hypothetical protein
MAYIEKFDDSKNEIKKVERRMPMWAKNGTQINSQIVRAFFLILDAYGKVTEPMLCKQCSPLIKDF